jgi:hypothetical protein
MALTLAVPSGDFHLSGNPLWVQVTGASAPTGSSCYKILLKVTSVDGVLSGGPFVDGKAPVSGEAWFDVSGYVDQPVEIGFEWPLSGGLNPYPEQTLDITFAAGESYIDADDQLVENWYAPTGSHFVVKGGVSPRSLGIYNDAGSSFYQDYVAGYRWLTHMPLVQTVAPLQPVKLWLLAAENRGCSFNIKAYYEDGSSYHYVNSGFVLYKDILHEFNCLPWHGGFDKMPPVKPTGVKMSRYEVWLEGLTDIRTFVVDHRYYENMNYLFVANSVGGIDVIWLRGSVKKGFDSATVEASRQFPRLGTARQRTRLVASRSGQRTWKINSGFKTREEIVALADCLLSKQVWLLENATGHNNGTLYPVTIRNSSTALTDSMEDLCSVDIEMEEAHDTQYI